MGNGTPPRDPPRNSGASDIPRQMQASGGPDAEKPDWADGLRQLYDSVVDEPLPDTFKDLLEKLGDDGDANGSADASGSDGSPR